jgi:hypothetical protein
MIAGFRLDADEIRALLEYYASLSGNPVPTFRDNLSVPSSRVYTTTQRCVTSRKSAVLMQYGAVNSGFPQAKESLRTLSAIRSRDLKKKFTSPVLGRKILKNVGLKEAKLMACEVRPHVWGRPCMPRSSFAQDLPQSVHTNAGTVLQVSPRRIPYTSFPVHCTFTHHCTVSALTTPILVLQTCGLSGRSYTYGETRALCRRFANALLGAVGLRQGDVLGLLLPNIPEYAIAMHGAIEAGIVVTFANPLYTPGGLQSFSAIGF